MPQRKFIVATEIIVLDFELFIGSRWQKKEPTEKQMIANFLEHDVLGSVGSANVDEATFSHTLDAAAKNLENKFKNKSLVKASISSCPKRAILATFLLNPTVKNADHTMRPASNRLVMSNEDDSPAVSM